MPVSLHLATSFDAAWENVLLPWFEKVAPQAFEQGAPVAVVTPFRSHAQLLRRKLLDHGISLLGVHFFVPAQLRELLLRDSELKLPLREHLRLLLAIAANEMEDQPNESEALAAKAVARSPAPLLRALDRLETAGWKFEESDLPSFAPVVQRFNEVLKKCDIVLRGESDRNRLQQPTRGRPQFSHLLVCGFDGAHWAEWFLLRSAVEMAENATIVLEEPGQNFPMSIFAGSAHGKKSVAKPNVHRTPTSALGDSLFSEMEMRGGAEISKHFDFLIGTNFSEQAEAITRQCVRCLADEKCTRLGVIFPGSGALPRLVASLLERLEIPHNDGLGHIVPGIFEPAAWQAWIELQRAPRLNSFLRFLNAVRDPSVVSPKISRPVFEKFCTRVTARCCSTTSNCCANSVRRVKTRILVRRPKLYAHCLSSRRAPRSHSFSNKLTPRLRIASGSNT